MTIAGLKERAAHLRRQADGNLSRAEHYREVAAEYVAEAERLERLARAKESTAKLVDEGWPV